MKTLLAYIFFFSANGMVTEINLDRCRPLQLPHINHRKNVNVCITLPGKGVGLFWQVFTRHSLVQLQKMNTILEKL